MIDYREMTAGDDAAVAKLIRDNLKKYKLDIPGTVYFDDGLDHLSDYYGTGDKRYFVIEDKSGRVIGGIGFARLDFMEDTAELQKLYLDDSARGSGLGYELIALVEEKMREAGFKHSYLETHNNLQAAIHIYEKSGYVEIAKPEAVVHSAMNRFFLKDL
jgi:putative acetyltransferase